MNEKSKRFIKGLPIIEQRAFIGRVLEGGGKKERSNLVDDFSLMRGKRFLLSLQPKLRLSLDRLQQGIFELQEEYREFIGFGLYGSRVRGYANSKSDIDGLVFLDYNKVISALEKTNSPDNLPDPEFLILSSKYRKIFHDVLLRQGLVFKKVGICFLQEKLIFDIVNSSELNTEDLDYLAPIFLMVTGGKEINLYRKIVIDQLRKRGSGGEKIWNQIMLRLYYQMESNAELEGDQKYLERFEKIYPKLDKAAQYFLGESSSIK